MGGLDILTLSIFCHSQAGELCTRLSIFIVYGDFAQIIDDIFASQKRKHLIPEFSRGQKSFPRSTTISITKENFNLKTKGKTR
jgi:hypothetical protein